MSMLTATVTKIVPLTDRVSEFTLHGKDLPDFAPGAHIRVQLAPEDVCRFMTQDHVTRRSG